MIEGFPSFDKVIVNEALFYFMENELLRQDVPMPTAFPTTFEKVFKTSNLARIRREDTTVTIFGGVDWPLIIASGRSVSPNFFSYRNGRSVLKHMRMSAAFFSMGYFRSEGLRQEGSTYILQQKLEAPYYQPLPEKLKNNEGDYELTPSVDGRFWSKMAFDQRRVSNLKTLDSKISITEDKGKVTLSFEVNGLEGVEVTIELCFDEAGKLSGITPSSSGQDNYFLSEGNGSFECGGDTINFGPGTKQHERINRLDGEQYSVHFGTLRAMGKHVYLTGMTPFEHTLTFE